MQVVVNNTRLDMTLPLTNQFNSQEILYSMRLTYNLLTVKLTSVILVLGKLRLTKLLNNVVCGTGIAMTETKQERRICDDCGNASMHEIRYQDGKSYYKKCLHCLVEYVRPLNPKEHAAKNKEALDSFFANLNI